MATATLRPPLLSRVQAAELLGVSPATLAGWHCRRRYHLPVIKVGDRAMYDPADIDRFIAERRVECNAPPG